MFSNSVKLISNGKIIQDIPAIIGVAEIIINPLKVRILALKCEVWNSAIYADRVLMDAAFLEQT